MHFLTVPFCLGTHTHVVSDQYTIFWAGEVAIAKMLSGCSTATFEMSEAYMSETTGTDETQEVSSVLLESSGSDGNLSLRKCPSVKSLVTSSSFSEAMSDKVTIDQQRKEEQNAMALVRDNSPASEELLRTGQWIQDTRSGLATSPQMGGFWPNSNNAAVNVIPQREGCSRAPH